MSESGDDGRDRYYIEYVQGRVTVQLLGQQMPDRTKTWCLPNYGVRLSIRKRVHVKCATEPAVVCGG